jgi:hypothetical protein
MAKTIWKFQLAIFDTQVIKVPLGSKLLTIQSQGGNACLWVLCDGNNPLIEQRKIALYGTGHLLPDKCGEYIATFQMGGGALVFHAFEVEL